MAIETSLNLEVFQQNCFSIASSALSNGASSVLAERLVLKRARQKKASDPAGKLGKNLLSFSSSLVRGFEVVGGRDVEETRR